MFGLIENMGRDVVPILKSIVGPSGCLLTPSFTFSFPQKFNTKTSLSTTGAMGKLFSSDKAVRRVPDGMTSYYLIGGRAQDILSKWQNTSYGLTSIPDQITKTNGKVLQLGTDILSLVHYLEQLVGVPYRHNLRFEGQVEDGDEVYDSYTMFYARSMKVDKLIPDPIRSEFYLTCTNKQIYNGRECRFFSCQEYITFGLPRLKDNEWILVNR